MLRLCSRNLTPHNEETSSRKWMQLITCIGETEIASLCTYECFPQPGGGQAYAGIWLKFSAHGQGFSFNLTSWSHPGSGDLTITGYQSPISFRKVPIAWWKFYRVGICLYAAFCDTNGTLSSFRLHSSCCCFIRLLRSKVFGTPLISFLYRRYRTVF